MNDIAKRKSTEIAVETNPFTAWGEAESQTSIVGKLLKFSKGDYLAGQDEEEVPYGAEFVANMDEMLVGWIRWWDNKPTDQIMGRVCDGYQLAARRELSDTNQDDWELDADNNARDPWQKSYYLLLKGVADNELYTFTTSSKGGRGALAKLCKIYGKLMAQHPDEWPIIALGGDSYPHNIKSYGRIKFPRFSIIAWARRDVFAGDEEVGEAERAEIAKQTTARI